KALQIFTDFNDPYSIVSCLCVDADIFVTEKKFDKALQTLQVAEKQAWKTQSPLLMERVYLSSANVYELTGDPKKALLYYKKHMHTRDSIVNDEIREEVTKKQLYYEFDKKHLSDSLEAQAKQKYLQQEVDNSTRRASLQRNISIISIFSFLIVAVLAFLIYRGLQRNKEANKLIGQKNKEILDSFYYAKKIQAALLPPIDFIREHLPETFILYKPKDIVSGDFYWMYKINPETILIAVGDCTGHGVPGAMVSVVCSNALNRAAKEFGLTDPGRILDKARELVIENFSESKSEVKDGMDISLCKIDLRHNDSKHINVEWAGANNPLWYTIGNCMVEVDPDKQPIGNAENARPFNTSEITLQKNEMLFLFTDGFADQFGGPRGIKFKYRPFQDTLLEIHKLPVDEQRKELEQVFEKWRGQLEQIDDVCIIGIRL
ncbi:MAG: PP2C family protein-serine/threonine phosphatase, partial [Bacteroidia bacterium]